MRYPYIWSPIHSKILYIDASWSFSCLETMKFNFVLRLHIYVENSLCKGTYLYYKDPCHVCCCRILPTRHWNCRTSSRFFKTIIHTLNSFNATKFICILFTSVITYDFEPSAIKICRRKNRISKKFRICHERRLVHSPSSFQDIQTSEISCMNIWKTEK